MAREPKVRKYNRRKHPMSNLQVVSGPAKGRLIPYEGTPKILVVAEKLENGAFWHDYTMMNDGSGRYIHSKECKCRVKKEVSQ